MKLPVVCVSAGLALMAGTAHAQRWVPFDFGTLPLYTVSDFDAPYSAVPFESSRHNDGATLLSPEEIFVILRDNGFAPLGELRRSGFLYNIAAINRDEEDGHLFIDARTGRIVRFVLSEEFGDNSAEDSMLGEARRNVSPPIAVRWPPRPPALVPHPASRRPTASLSGRPPTGSAEPKALEATAKTAAAAREPAPSVLPTQPMPQVQALE